MTNNNPAAPTPTPATPDLANRSRSTLVFRNAVENLAFATLIQGGILTGGRTHAARTPGSTVENFRL